MKLSFPVAVSHNFRNLGSLGNECDPMLRHPAAEHRGMINKQVFFKECNNFLLFGLKRIQRYQAAETQLDRRAT